MSKYIVKRVFMIIPIVLAIIFVLFIMLYMLPGSRIRLMPIYRDGDALDSVFETLDVPDNMITKYIRYCYNIFFHLDFGKSLTSRVNLFHELSNRIRNTIYLLGGGAGLTLLFGIPLGVYTAVRKNSWADRFFSALSLFFSSIPSYALAISFALIFSVYLRILPLTSGIVSVKAYIMPTTTIALGGIAAIARMTRASMLETLEQPYITALRAKGLGEARVICVHALKNALIPVVSSLGAFIAQLLCGALVVEYFFNALGLGSYMLRSVGTRDHMEILGCTVVLTMLLAVINIVVDVLYMLLSPQIKLRYTGVRGGLRKRGAK